jgi:hypothetical protein
MAEVSNLRFRWARCSCSLACAGRDFKIELEEASNGRDVPAAKLVRSGHLVLQIDSRFATGIHSSRLNTNKKFQN